METLKEIIQVLTKNRVNKIEIIEAGSNQKSRVNELFKGIESGRFQNDEDAIFYFYGTSPKGKTSYNKLKRRLEKRLINTIFFIDVNQPNYNDIQKAYYASYRDWAAVKILLGKFARQAAIPIAKRILKNASKFEFSDLALDVARILRYHYAVILYDKKNFEKYNVLVKKFKELLNAELIAEEYHQFIANNLKSSTFTDQFISNVEGYFEELKIITSRLQSYRLNLYSFLTFVLRYQIVNDYKNMLVECEQAVAFFESKKHQASKVAIWSFLYRILACCIPLKEFEKGEKTAIRCLELLEEGIGNWFNVLDQYLLLSFHTNNLQQAFQIFYKAYTNKNFNKLYEKASENWKTHEAYIHYFISIGAIKPPEKEMSNLKPFRLSRFLNDVPVHSKDKRRGNIPILIIHVLFLLQQKKYEKVIDRVESLNLYCYRYLRKDDTLRSNCFIKMLLQLPKANFHREAVIRKTKKYHNMLLDNPSNLKMQSSEVEIMPYEMLWEYVLDSLDNKIHSKR